MRQVTATTVSAFMQGSRKSVGNTMTDGTSLFLHANKIAERRDDGIYITNAGWQSNTTKERLNGIPGVSISQWKGVWYLNGTEWNGQWIKVIDTMGSPCVC